MLRRGWGPWHSHWIPGISNPGISDLAPAFRYPTGTKEETTGKGGIIVIWKGFSSISVACDRIQDHFVPSGTHYRWVNKGFCLQIFYMTRSGNWTPEPLMLESVANTFVDVWWLLAYHSLSVWRSTVANMGRMFNLARSQISFSVSVPLNNVQLAHTNKETTVTSLLTFSIITSKA